MKRTLLIFIGLSCYVLGVAQSITSITPNNAQQGQTINVTIIGQNSNFGSASGAALYGGNPYIYLGRTSQTVVSPTEVNATFSIPSSMATGVYNLELWPNSAYGIFTVNPASPNLSTVQGTIFIDSDNNCLVGPGEPKIPNGIVTFSPGPFYAISDASGNFSASIPSGNYTATYIPNYGFSLDCPVSQSYPVNISTPGSSATNLDFGLDTVQIQDVRTYFYCPPIRRGFPQSGFVSVSNYSAIPYSGVLTLVKDPLVNLSGVSPVPGYASPDTVTWPVTLSGGGQAYFNFNLTGDLQLQLGDTVQFACYTDTTVFDSFPENNRVDFDRIIIGSFDPNDKSVTLPSGANADGPVGMTDTTFIYRVRFQNTGTDTAFIVVIRDTMDSRLDLSTLRVLSSSHPYTMNLDPYGRVEFDFPNIMLPDSFVNEPASNGYIIYEVNRFSNVLEGNSITNRASIYFDFNAPVLTNTVASQLCVPLSVDFNYAASGSAVSFTNQSSGTLIGRSWDFGDGNTTSILSPTHTYASPGVYNVCLTITSPCFTETHCETITVCQQPNASYQATPSLLNVAFQDQSSSSTFSWSWTFGDGNTSTLQNPNHSYTQSGNYTVCLTVTDSCSATTTCSVVNVTCPNPNVGYSSSTNFFQASFTDQSTAQSGATYSWNFGDGNTSTQQSPNHTYATAGSYVACLTVNDACASVTYCDTINVVCPAPNVGYSSSTSFFQASFTNQSTAQSGATYAWTFGDGNTSTMASPSHTYATAGSYVACLTVNDVCGSVTHCDTINVVCPAPNVGYSSSTSFFQASFTNQSTAQSGATYAWDFGDGNTSTMASPSHTYAAAGSYVACLTVNDLCGSVTHCDTVQVICPAPGVAFNNSTNLFQASFTNQSTAQSGATYSWDFGDGNTSTLMSPTHTYSSTGFFQACLTVTDLCGSATFCDLVLINCPAPTSAFTWTESQLQATFSNQGAGSGTVTYAWDFGDGNVSTQQAPNHTYGMDGTYLVCLTITDDCGSANYCDTVVAVCAPPQAAINHTVNGLQVQFNDNSSGTIVSQFWDFGDGNTSTSASPMHTYGSGGTYTACLQVTNDCGAVDTSCVTLTGLVNVINPGPFHTIALYPNPNDGRFNLETELVSPGHLQLRIYNMLGKQISEMDQGTVQGVFHRQIDLGDLPMGNYLMQFDLDGKTVNRIFTIQH